MNTCIQPSQNFATEPFRSEGEAKAAATAKLAQAARAKQTLTLTMPANPSITAQTPLTIIGFRNGVDGTYIAKTVKHQITGSKFTTSITAELKT